MKLECLLSLVRKGVGLWHYRATAYTVTNVGDKAEILHSVKADVA